ncbi:DUF7288 family protein [Halogranum rubrum]|nr:hypothetical protein [Halogranum salarium]
MRAQAHTLEAVTAGLILVMSVIFALQATAVTPLSASTSNQHIENQQQASADGLLATAQKQGVLKPALLFWADTDSDGDYEFHNPDNDQYYTGIDSPPQNQFLVLIDEAFGGRGVAVNVNVQYQTTTGDNRRQRLLYQGNPSDNAVTATKLVTLYEGDVLYKPDGGDDDLRAEPTSTVIDTSNFYAPDTDGDGAGTGIYSVLRVEVVVWRM